jgi:hypothetical protein
MCQASTTFSTITGSSIATASAKDRRVQVGTASIRKACWPMKVPAEKLRNVLGVTSVNYVEGHNTLAVVDSPLAG